MSFTIIDVTPDTDEWLDERRRSVGASEVAAVLGMSAYGQTPLDVYKAKMGADSGFDPVLGFIGHASEPIMHEWVERFSGLGVTLSPGFMARSVEHPYLHATFDRVASDGTKVQMKTAHQYAGHHWDEGVPTDIRVQVQAELAVSGDARELVVVWIGGREFRYYWEPRDDRFIQEHLLPGVRAFWNAHVALGVPPQPSTVAEIAEQWPTGAEPMEVTDELMERIEQRAFLLATAKEAEEDAEKIKVTLGQFMVQNEVDTFTRAGRTVLTFKKQSGRSSLDVGALRRDHPDLVDGYTTQGAPFMVMRTYKPKEKK
ncbi:YqaJ viral recombinase family protein [Microbacterium sp. KR10-403]|uniref:YqaJ viral recombinase family nuclease n=1 Tax=Microbacterium sp. KR10-403 TaxID=3158581 RepID=UPI0032E4CFE1